MTRSLFNQLAVCFLTLCCLVSIPTALDAQTVAGKRPNIIILVADDLGYGETGCQGNSQIPTPHIDSIATRGVRFTNGYVTAAFCSASRAGLLTGQYQNRFGYEFNPIGAKNEDPLAGLPPQQKTLADHLQIAGYTTGLIGKWHLGGTAKYHPQRRGFDEFFGFLHEGHYFVPPPYDGVTTMLRRKALPDGSMGRWQSRSGRTIYTTHMGHMEPDYDADNPILRGGQPVVETEYLTDALTREAVRFVDRNADRPFFLYLAYNAVHSPLQGANQYMQKFAHIDDIHRQIFAAMLSNMDDSVGEVLSRLDRNGIRDDTIVFFLSDNGGPTRELTSSNAPLRGEKGSMYEGGIRIPFLVSWPGHLPEAVEYEQPVISLDMFPTITAAAGLNSGVNRDSDGVNLLPYLNGETHQPPHDTLWWRTGRKAALRHGNWKLVNSPNRRSPDQWQLYDLSADIGEQADLATAKPTILADLVQRWQKMNSEMMDPVWGP